MLCESPVVTVHIPPELRPYAGGHAEITASGDTVGEIIEAAGHECPMLRPHLLAVDGSLRPGLAVYLGASSVNSLQGLATPVAQEELVTIVLSGVAASVLE